MATTKRSPLIYQELPNIVPNWKEVDKAETICLKAFWFTITMISVGLLIDSVYFVVVDYMEYPVVTSNQVILNDHIPLPPIYICADNPIGYNTFTDELFLKFGKRWTNLVYYKL